MSSRELDEVFSECVVEKAYCWLNSYYLRDVGREIPRLFFDEVIVPHLSNGGITYSEITRLIDSDYESRNP